MKGNTYKYQKIRMIERKLYLLHLRGDCCERCGYDKNLSAIDFHHKDPKTKKFQLDARTLSNNSMETIMEEFVKCEALCSNCHRELHNPDCELSLLFDKVDEFTNAISIKHPGKPKCIDCEIEINYGYERCLKCRGKSIRKPRPDLSILIDEIKEYGHCWCGRKYNVSHTTIRRWLK